VDQTVDEMRAELARGGIGFPMTDEEVPSVYRSIILGVPSEDPPEEPADPESGMERS
jgi:hypothetical protein